MTFELLVLSGLKATALAACGLVSVHLLPQAWVTARRSIALLAMWSLLYLPWVTLSLPATLPHASVASLPTVPASALATTLPLAMWAAGLLFRLCRLGAESRLLFKMARAGEPCGNQMRMVEGIATPCMWGLVRPCILMPVAARGWSPAQWRSAVLHEQQHIRQHDGWHRMAAALVRCLFWWNPLVHALCRRLEIESELRCDEAATACSSRRDYGRMLLDLATRPAFETVPAWAAGSVKERIQRIIAPAHCGPAKALARSVMGVCMLALGIVAGCCLEDSPQKAANVELHQETAIRLEADPFPLH